MTGPRFISTNFDVTLANPIDWKTKELLGEAADISLNGTELVDVFYRKYQYLLDWDTMSVEDYENLHNVIKDQIDNGSLITFIYGKWTETFAGVTAKVRLGERGFRAGSGETGYYSKVQCIVTDVSNRQ